MQPPSTKIECPHCLGCPPTKENTLYRSQPSCVDLPSRQSMNGITGSMDHTCATSPGQFLVPISDTACSSELAVAIAVFSLRCFLLPVWLRVTACSDSPVARRRGFLIRGSSLYSGRAIPCLRDCCTTDTCLGRFRVWGGRRMLLSAWCMFPGCWNR